MLQIRQTSKLQTKLQNDVKKLVDELKNKKSKREVEVTK